MSWFKKDPPDAVLADQVLGGEPVFNEDNDIEASEFGKKVATSEHSTLTQFGDVWIDISLIRAVCFDPVDAEFDQSATVSLLAINGDIFDIFLGEEDAAALHKWLDDQGASR